MGSVILQLVVDRSLERAEPLSWYLLISVSHIRHHEDPPRRPAVPAGTGLFRHVGDVSSRQTVAQTAGEITGVRSAKENYYLQFWHITVSSCPGYQGLLLGHIKRTPCGIHCSAYCSRGRSNVQLFSVFWIEVKSVYQPVLLEHCQRHSQIQIYCTTSRRITIQYIFLV